MRLAVRVFSFLLAVLVASLMLAMGIAFEVFTGLEITPPEPWVGNIVLATNISIGLLLIPIAWWLLNMELCLYHKHLMARSGFFSKGHPGLFALAVACATWIVSFHLLRLIPFEPLREFSAVYLCISILFAMVAGLAAYRPLPSGEAHQAIYSHE